MASATPVYTPPPIELPSRVGDNRRLMFASNVAQRAAFRRDDGEFGEEHPLPAGTKEIYLQARLRGDFYCFIHGSRQVSAVGETVQAAFFAALQKAHG